MSDQDDSPTSSASGVVLFAGGTDFENMLKRLPAKGKRPTEAELERSEFYQDLLAPHRLLSLDTIRIRFVASGCAALHAVAVDSEGNAYVWGRNLEGQLGLGDRIQRNQPTKVPDMTDVVWGSCGRAHTVLVQSDGKSHSSGDNKLGQLGTDSDLVQYDQFSGVVLSKTVIKSSCGSDFTLLLTGEGMLYACGSGENGCLGDGSDHTYNSKTHSIKMEIEPQPKPKLIQGLENVTNVASGVNHSVCVTEAGSVFTWGCGDYGRLGHGVQKDELRPKRLDWFSGARALPADCLLACGGTSTIVSGAHGTYWWGKVKNSGDAMMTPTICEDLRGWKVRSISASKATFAVSAESSTILWGQAIHGELAGGANGKKTSARPAKCMPLEGMVAHKVACGNGFTIFLMDDSETSNCKKLSSFALYEAPDLDPFAGTVSEDEAAAPEPAKKKKAGRGKRKREQ